MPELPEVETVARDLEQQLPGRRFTGARLAWARTLATPDAGAFSARLAGREVLHVGRRGKYLVIHLDSGELLVVHLRMTGRLEVVSGDSPVLEDAHLRARLDMADGHYLAFIDARKFGRIWLVTDLSEVTGKLGPEPLAGDFGPAQLAGRVRRRRSAVKALLLDQTVVAGLGNIYADEALHAAGIHPLRQGAGLTDEEIARLHAAIQAVLLGALSLRGTLLRDYRPPYGPQGGYQERLKVYGRAGRPCPRCGTPIERIRVVQRSTHFCPHCQNLEDGVRVVAASDSRSSTGPGPE